MLKTNYYRSATNQSFRKKSIGNQNEYQVVPEGLETLIVVKRGDVIKEHLSNVRFAMSLYFFGHSLTQILVVIKIF